MYHVAPQPSTWRAALLGGLCLALFYVAPESASAQDDTATSQARQRVGQALDRAIEEAEAQPDTTTQIDDVEAPDQSARDEAIFGGEPDDEDVASSTPLAPSPYGVSPPTRDDRLLGEWEGSSAVTDSITERLMAADEELAIGGFLFMQSNLSVPQGGDLLDEALISSPNLLDLYLDVRPTPRLRMYARGRLNYNWSRAEQSPTVVAPAPDGMPGDGEGDVLDTGAFDLFGPLQGGATGRLSTQLDQLWLKFDIEHKVYITLGRQRIRWGAGRFWNPTDFLNATQINPIALFDQRLGVDLVKLHVPIERAGWNFYAIGLLGEAGRPSDLGGALRAELLWDTTEIALSFVARTQTFEGPRPIEPVYEPSLPWPNTTTPLRFGADLSTGFWIAEVRAELALTHGQGRSFYTGELVIDPTDLSSLSFPRDISREDDWIVQATIGGDLSWTYGDGDTIIVGGEYFFNDAGYESPDLYLWTVLQGGFRPLYMGRHYGALALVLPSPGDWDDTSWTASVLGNLSDRSFLARVDYSMRLLTELSWNVFAMTHFGEQGEFFYRVTLPSLSAGGAPIDIAPTRWSLGTGFRLSF